jgi:hypothetical protein
VLKIELVAHATVLQRAQAALAKIDQRMVTAQRTGALSEFNQQYRERRLAAAKQGRKFMSYSAATARLRKALAKAAAGEPVAIVREVFDPR